MHCLIMKSLHHLGRRTLCSLSHVDMKTGIPKMVDVSHKAISARTAHARATVILPKELSQLMVSSSSSSKEPSAEIFGKKGPVFATAIVAGVMAAKKTAELIPFCHPVALDDCKIDITISHPIDPTMPTNVTIDCTVKTTHKTGVEMEALVGATNTAMCIYDMLKAVSHDIQVTDIKLMEKTGGKSHFKRE